MKVPNWPSDLRPVDPSESSWEEALSQPASGGTQIWSLARVVLDGASLALAIALSSLLRFELEWFALNEVAKSDLQSHLYVSLIWVVVFMISAAWNHLYDGDTLLPGGGEGSRIVRSVIDSVAVVSVLVFLGRTFAISRSWFVLVALMSMIVVTIQRGTTRAILGRLRARGSLQRPVLVVTSGGVTRAVDILEGISEFKVQAVLRFDELMKVYLDTPSGERVAATSLSLVVDTSSMSDDDLYTLLLKAGQTGQDVLLYSHVPSVGRNRLTVRELGRGTLFKIMPPRLVGIRAFQKRLFDILVSLIAIILLSPLLLLISLLILVTSGPPLFFGQERMGKDGRVFKMWKFRSMRRDAEAKIGQSWAAVNDPRRTVIGRVLRRWSLDELPQLWNVLRGDMSIVGPRPEMSTIASRLSREIHGYEERHRIRPGITGWAQAHGLRGHTSLTSRVELDNWYIENWSLGLDLSILLRTFLEIFRGENAY